ncbi:MAG: TRC40/GET3/ArsA family transport-energizing ATPase [Nitrososphaerales archaeon]
MRLILYTGKGGTGKTVSSCATALRSAERGHATLIISADPAHTLSDAYAQNVGDEVTHVYDHLDALQIDPVNEMNKQYQQLLSYMASLFSSKGIDETLAYEIAMLPGMTQLFSLLKIEEIKDKETYDVVVLDMMASGEALRYLYFPKLIGSLNKRLMNLTGLFSGIARIFEPIARIPAPSSAILKIEFELVEKLEKLADIIKDHDITSIRLVANPDSFSIENAKRALMSANLYGINVDMAILNKIMPKVEEAYFAKWADFQEGKVKEAEANFYPLPVKKLKLFETELKGIEMLERYSKELFDNEDATQVFYKGEPFNFETLDESFNMKVKVPFTEKDDFDIERFGDQLTIKVRNEVGQLVNIVPLPAATMGMKMSKAKLQGDELNILFEKAV